MADAVTYQLDSVDPLIVEISKVRFELGDTVAGRGPRADHSNFTDAEITMVLDSQGDLGDDNRPLKAVASLCDTLSRDWSKIASSITVGPRSQQYAQAEYWAKRATALGARFGITATGFAFSVTPKRADGYADNAAGAEFG